MRLALQVFRPVTSGCETFPIESACFFIAGYCFMVSIVVSTARQAGLKKVHSLPSGLNLGTNCHIHLSREDVS